MPTWIKILAIFVYAAGIAACIYFIGGTTLTPRESALLSLILAILSVLASWTLAHIYNQSLHSKAIKEVQEFHKTNLKTYARKAAEKVNNLSNELNRLSLFLEKELNTTDYKDITEALSAKEERIESSIHIINTLKSVNDTALSDWEGVIGDELDQQRQAKEEQREEELEEIMSKYESLMTSLTAMQANLADRGDYALLLRSEIDSLRNELHFLHSRMIGTPIRPPSLLHVKKNTVEHQCPVCKNPLAYKQKPKQTAIKAIKCKSCDSNLISRYRESSGFTLELRRPLLEEFPCPSCGKQCHVEIDPMPNSTTITNCPNCQSSIRVIRLAGGLRCRTIQIPSSKGNEKTIKKLDEHILNLVKDGLPPQPWPHHIHKSLSQRLGLSNTVVNAAINELIRKGVFHPQINGKLYVPMPSTDQNQPEIKKEA